MPEEPVSILKKALRKSVIVEVSRRIQNADEVEGFVVGLGRQWVLMQPAVEDLHLDGYEALRLRDIAAVRVTYDQDAFYARAVMEFAAQTPRWLEGIDLHSFPGLVASVAQRYPILMIHPEADDPEIGFIGAFLSVTSGRLRLRLITPEADWNPEPASWRSSEITRVSFGTRYEDALAAFGGPPPKGG